jgi:DNA primase small subunit
MSISPATNEFLRQRFSEYYRDAILTPPPSLAQREWGFIMFSCTPDEVRMRRHMGFLDREEMAGYIKNLLPQHAYYSTAYYEKPDAGTMADKGWTGADLIFDLDADHIVRGSYEMMLSRVKNETIKLLDMLTQELGIDPKTIELVFSGGRGYHVHVRDIATRGWGSTERRELIDYVCAIGIDPGAMLAGKRQAGPSWQGRFRDTLTEYIQWIGSLPQDEAMAQLTAMEGVGKESAAQFLRRKNEILAQIAEEPNPAIAKIRVLSSAITQTDGEFRKRLLAKTALADEPVTTDTKRLIRMPTSLHGGSGMRVQPLGLREIQTFDPLVDAVVFSDREVKVDARFPLSMSILGSKYVITKGVNSVPEALAVFLCCRGIAGIA